MAKKKRGPQMGLVLVLTGIVKIYGEGRKKEGIVGGNSLDGTRKI